MDEYQAEIGDAGPFQDEIMALLDRVRQNILSRRDIPLPVRMRAIRRLAFVIESNSAIWSINEQFPDDEEEDNGDSSEAGSALEARGRTRG